MIRIKLFEMFEKKAEIRRKISYASEQIDLHLVKLILFPKTTYVDYWMKGIWKFLSRVDKLKNNKFPSSKFIKNALSTHNDTIDRFIKTAKSGITSDSPRIVNSQEVLKAIEKYQSWLSYNLSIDGQVTQENVKNIIKQIINEIDYKRR